MSQLINLRISTGGLHRDPGNESSVELPIVNRNNATQLPISEQKMSRRSNMGVSNGSRHSATVDSRSSTAHLSCRISKDPQIRDMMRKN